MRTIRHRLEDCDGDYEAVARRKKHSRRSDCVRTAEKVLEDTGIGNPNVWPPNSPDTKPMDYYVWDTVEK